MLCVIILASWCNDADIFLKDGQIKFSNHFECYQWFTDMDKTLNPEACQQVHHYFEFSTIMTTEQFLHKFDNTWIFN